MKLPQYPTKGCRKIWLSENLLGRPIGQHRTVNEHNLIAKLRYAAEVVRGNENDAACLAQFT